MNWSFDWFVYDCPEFLFDRLELDCVGLFWIVRLCLASGMDFTVVRRLFGLIGCDWLVDEEKSDIVQEFVCGRLVSLGWFVD